MFKTIYVPLFFSRKLTIFVLASYSTQFGRIFYVQNGRHLGFHGEGLSLTSIPVAEKCFLIEEISHISFWIILVKMCILVVILNFRGNIVIFFFVCLVKKMIHVFIKKKKKKTLIEILSFFGENNFFYRSLIQWPPLFK